jgi:hypothetical protein
VLRHVHFTVKHALWWRAVPQPAGTTVK